MEYGIFIGTELPAMVYGVTEMSAVFNKIEKFLNSANISFDTIFAQTNSCYFEICGENAGEAVFLKVRVSNHAPRYGCDISVDVSDKNAANEAIDFICEKLSLDRKAVKKAANLEAKKAAARKQAQKDWLQGKITREEFDAILRA